MRDRGELMNFRLVIDVTGSRTVTFLLLCARARDDRYAAVRAYARKEACTNYDW